MKLTAQGKDLIRLALKEDLSLGDPTTAALVKRDKDARALIFARDRGIICGLKFAQIIFATIDPRVKFKFLVPEGSHVKTNTPLAEVKGKARTLFKAERIVLNYIQHLSGIATNTFRFLKKTKPSSIRITDTRKTTPGLRQLEKYAVRVGGGFNHRMALGDSILIKDNHWRFLPQGSLMTAVREVKKMKPHLKIEVEVKTIFELKKALEAGIDIVMLDNMNYIKLKRAIKLIKDWRRSKGEKKPIIEISGGVNLDNVGRLSRLGAEQISVGALTHSASAFPVDMEIFNG